MAQVVGDIDVTLDGVTYTLHMGMRELARLQDDFGQDLAPYFMPVAAGGLPKFGAYLRMVEVSLDRWHGGVPDTVAEDILAARPGIVAELLAAAFPSAKLPAGAKPGKRPATPA